MYTNIIFIWCIEVKQSLTQKFIIIICIITTTASESGMFESCFVTNAQYYQRLSIQYLYNCIDSVWYYQSHKSINHYTNSYVKLTSLFIIFRDTTTSGNEWDCRYISHSHVVSCGVIRIYSWCKSMVIRALSASWIVQ